MKYFLHIAYLFFMSFSSYAGPVILRSADGRSITVTVTGLNGSEVIITKQDGITYQIPLDKLDNNSKEIVKAEVAKLNKNIENDKTMPEEQKKNRHASI